MRKMSQKQLRNDIQCIASIKRSCDSNNLYYYVPSAFFHHKKYKELSAGAKILYSVMLDRIRLNPRTQDLKLQSGICINFSTEETMSLLNCSEKKAKEIYKELDSKKGVGLIDVDSFSPGPGDPIYVHGLAL